MQDDGDGARGAPAAGAHFLHFVPKFPSMYLQKMGFRFNEMHKIEKGAVKPAQAAYLLLLRGNKSGTKYEPNIFRGCILVYRPRYILSQKRRIEASSGLDDVYCAEQVLGHGGCGIRAADALQRWVGGSRVER